MLRKKWDVNEPTVHERKTPLMVAVANNHVLMVKFLFENGAKADTIDYSGRAANDYFTEITCDKIRYMVETRSKKRLAPKTQHGRTNSF